MADNKYCVEHATTGRSSCKGCKQKIDKSALRIGKVSTNPFSDDGGEMKVWYHAKCMFDALTRARATTKKIESLDDLDGSDALNSAEQAELQKMIDSLMSMIKKGAKVPGGKKAAVQTTLTGATKSPGSSAASSAAVSSTAGAAAASSSASSDAAARDNSLRKFRRLCLDLEGEPSYTAKTKLISNYIKNGKFHGDHYMLFKTLLPNMTKRVYHLKNNSLIKVFSQVFGADLDDMTEDLEQDGDVSETIRRFFASSDVCPPAASSALSLHEVDRFLDDLTQVSKERDQQVVLTRIAKRCTANDLKYIIRLIKHDLRIFAGAKCILGALDENAYAAFQASQDLADVVRRCLGRQSGVTSPTAASGGGSADSSPTPAMPGMKKALSIKTQLMTPIKPMLAEACRSVDMAMKKCPHGMYAEIKYDGERVQMHKSADKFEFYSRSLKQVMPHKVADVKDFVPKACPHGHSMVLDGEVLLVDTQTGKPLPFGTLSAHKKTHFQNASVCIFIFDLLFFNGESLVNKTLQERRQLLSKNVTEIKNHIQLSEMHLVKKRGDLSHLIARAINEGLEGLVLKDTQGVYEPGKRHWLKVKKDYLADGAMADTADLVVLGAYYGTGSKGGLMSVFLMGCWDPATSKWKTVCKVGNGFDDAKIAKLQKELKMTAIHKDSTRVPAWLDVKSQHVPDFVSADPKASPVWEITGAEYSTSHHHTAGGISIRFPRVTRVRDDKDWNTATNLDRLKKLVQVSSSKNDMALTKKLLGEKDADEDEDQGEDVPFFTFNGGATGGVAASSTSGAAAVAVSSTSGAAAIAVSSSTASIKTDTPMDASDSTSATEAKTLKRKREVDDEDSEDETFAKRLKPMCQYGEKCYQTNAKHLARFRHPSDPSPTLDWSVKKPLPDYFSDVTAKVHTSLLPAKEIQRHIVAYGGKVVNGTGAADATHFITEVETTSPENAVPVTPAWVWDSIKATKLQNPEQYKPA
ncbi:DNA ligase 3-like [Sycon ciliatum]|uniref:DNA ligase 3-like n=1 Tax=Sycon ciliatum TaxID=27933 RepID=UPI0031F6D2BB